MILTGKAKEDFEEWYINTDSSITHHLQKELFYSKAYIERNAYYLEWFDSVEMYIEITRDKIITEQWVNNVEIFPLYEKRQEATEQAIIKANEIYNENIQN